MHTDVTLVWRDLIACCFKKQQLNLVRWGEIFCFLLPTSGWKLHIRGGSCLHRGGSCIIGVEVVYIGVETSICFVFSDS